MRFGGIVLATALALGACSSSDPAPIEPQRSATTPTPTATAPPMPDQARQDSPEGAAAFVKHYVDVFNYAAATGDVEELTRLSAPTCEGCQSYISLITKTYGDGGYFKGGKWALSEIEVEQSSSTRRVFAHLDAPAGTQRVDEVSEPGPTSPENAELAFIVTSTQGENLVSKLVRAEP
ncbi:DUF6318 family protein [Aeromicrobium yanjiei]|uniref:DUF6318 family protein n=1 Tax=Aeromicrobium yanjiei TaxID=2662028 RepID=UPI0022A65C80